MQAEGSEEETGGWEVGGRAGWEGRRLVRWPEGTLLGP